MLANCCMWRCRDEGTMVTIGRWRPPWLGCVFYLASTLANCVSNVPQPQNHPKINNCPTSYLCQLWSDGDLSSTHPMRMHGWKTHEPQERKICSSWGWRCLVKHRKSWLNFFVAIYCTFTLTSNILQIYLVHSTYDRFLCTRAMKEGKKGKPTVIPSKSHSIAVFILSPPCPLSSSPSMKHRNCKNDAEWRKLMVKELEQIASVPSSPRIVLWSYRIVVAITIASSNPLVNPSISSNLSSNPLSNLSSNLSSNPSSNPSSYPSPIVCKPGPDLPGGLGSDNPPSDLSSNPFENPSPSILSNPSPMPGWQQCPCLRCHQGGHHCLGHQCCPSPLPPRINLFISPLIAGRYLSTTNACSNFEVMVIKKTFSEMSWVKWLMNTVSNASKIQDAFTKSWHLHQLLLSCGAPYKSTLLEIRNSSLASKFGSKFWPYNSAHSSDIK